MDDGAAPPAPRATGARPAVVRIEGDLDRKGAEALALEIRRLARRLGVDVAEVRIVTDAAGESGGAVGPETPR
jgi:hypothetical protein